MSSNRSRRKTKSTGEWAVVVRLPDGRVRYYAEHTERSGQSQWSPRESQAHRFPSAEAAEALMEGWEPNGAAREYAVISLPYKRE